MSPITTHVLDTALGRPAAGITITLALHEGGALRPLGRGITDADGRVRDLLPDDHALAAGLYRIVFETGAYHAALGTAAFYPRVIIDFEIVGTKQHYHVPLLLSPFGFSTYRGS